MSEPATCRPGLDPPANPAAGPPPPRGNAGKGRPKGSLNKVTLAAREAILLAAEKMGGVDALVEWANKNDENRRIFWSVIYPKVLPYGGGPTADSTPPVTGILVWQRPDDAEDAEWAQAAAATSARPGAEAPAQAEIGATARATEEAPAAESTESLPPSPAATAGWKAPEPGMATDSESAGGGATGPEADPRPPPANSS